MSRNYGELLEKARGLIEQKRWKDENEEIALQWALVDALAFMPYDNDKQLSAEVVSLFDGAPYRVFRFLDEKPGQFGYEVNGKEWHWKLRRTRNSRESGLFDVLARA